MSEIVKITIAGKEFEVQKDLVSQAMEKNEPISIVDENLVINTKAEIATRETNLKEIHEKVGADFAVKKAAEKLKIDITELSEKSVSALVEVATKKALESAKIEPDKKVLELTNDIKTLQSTISGLETEKNTLSGQLVEFKQNTIRKGEYERAIPENLAIPKQDMITILEARIKTTLDDSGRLVVLGEDGQVMKNPTTLDPLPLSDVTKDFFAKNQHFLKGASGGNGGGDDTTPAGGKKPLSQYVAEKQAAGVQTTGQAFAKECQDLANEGKLDLNA